MAEVSTRATLGVRRVGAAVLAAILLLTACNSAGISNNPTPSQTATLDYGASRAPDHEGVPYDGCQLDCERRKLDIYLPDVAPVGVIIRYHSGGFYMGDRAPMDQSGHLMAQNDLGWIIVSASYRLAVPNDPGSAPRTIGDATRAAEWVASPAAGAYGIPSDVPIVTSGHSAGGTLAALVALELPANTISGWISIAGILSWNAGPLSAHWANTLHQGLAFLPEPIARFGPGSPPGYLIHGVSDPIVEPENSNLASSAAASAGMALQLDLVDNFADGTPLPNSGVGHVPQAGGLNVDALSTWLTSLT